jgi:hypothetical protein
MVEGLMPNEHLEPFPEASSSTATESQKPTRSKAEVMAEIKARMDELNRLEATTGPSGAIPRSTKAILLDKTEAEAKNPDKRIRWVNLANQEKALLRTVVQGYVRLPEQQGGRQVGNLVLCALPRDVYEERVEQQKKIQAERLSAKVTDMEEAFEGIARLFQDRYGMKLDVKRLLINE